MALIMAIWQKAVWCALIGGGIGVLVGVIALFQRTPANGQNSIFADLIFNAIVGTFFGLIVLGIPSSLWTVGRWVFGGARHAAVATPPALPNGAQLPEHQLLQDAGRGAMAGSAAAVPGAILGTIGGLVLAGLVLGGIMFISLLTGAIWFDEITKHWLTVWFLSGAAIGALIGFLAGTFLGGAVGAIMGGVRAFARH